MTEIERKALALVNEVRASHGLTPYENLYATPAAIEALCRAIEQHEAFRQEVSDAVEDLLSGAVFRKAAHDRLSHFIIAKPDPLVDVFDECFSRQVLVGETWSEGMARVARAAIEKRGGKIVWGEG